MRDCCNHTQLQPRHPVYTITDHLFVNKIIFIQMLCVSNVIINTPIRKTYTYLFSYNLADVSKHRRYNIQAN